MIKIRIFNPNKMIDTCEDKEAGNPFPKLLINLNASAEEA
jgi:hypothetical protein